MKTCRRWAMGLWAFCALVLSGCTGAGIAQLRDIAPSTADYRYEVEYIASATLVREDTSPDWQLGRYAFKRGADGLLVVSRITSYVEPEYGNKSRAERVLERVWITVPLGTSVGEILKLEHLEQQFLVGYDEGSIGGNEAMFVQPNRVLGKVMLEEEITDTLVVSIDMRVQPIRVPSWSYKGVVTVPVGLSGVRARPVERPITEQELAPPEAEQETDDVVASSSQLMPEPQLESVQDDEQAAFESAPLPQPQASEVAATQPSTQAASAEPGEDADDKKRTILGNWRAVTAISRQKNQYDVYLQLIDNGRFVHATVRGGGVGGKGYEPGMKYGWWQVRGEYLVLDVEKFVFTNQNSNHLQAFGNDSTKYSYITLGIAWDGDDLLLTGNYAHPMGDKENFGKKLKLRFQKADFPDLRHYRPKPNRRPGFEPGPEPEDYQITGMRRVHHTKVKKK